MPTFSDIAILYRFNAQAGPIQKYLSKQGIPYIVQGGMGFWKQREVKDILAFLSWIANPLDRASLERASKNLKLKCNKKMQDLIFPDVKPGNTIDDLIALTQSRVVRPTATSSQFLKILNFSKDNKDKKAKDILLAFYKDFKVIETLKEEDRKEKTKDICREDSANTLIGLAEDMNLSDFLDSSKLNLEEEDDPDVEKNAVTLSTFHKAKGKLY